jgi:hypothetical protein
VHDQSYTNGSGVRFKESGPHASDFQFSLTNGSLSLIALGLESGVGLQIRESQDWPKLDLAWLLLYEDNPVDTNPYPYAKSLDARRVDWDVAREWISHCISEHNTDCRIADCLMLSDFRVIDCKTRDIILAPPNCAFAALSYVWGDCKQPPLSFWGRLPSPATLVVEDAVVATLAIGFRYLWIDQYCIDQTNPRTKHYLIQNMDKIYRGASVTLISASGENADAGLPGVSCVPRRNQISTRLPNGQILAMVSDIRREVSAAKWSSRAWTYQEGLLSRRRLVFTSSQIYYQCSKMHCCESVIDSPDVRPSHALRDYLQVFPHDGVGYSWDAETRIREYIQRELSYQSDALNAFTGVLQQLWKAWPPVYHFWGLTFDASNLVSNPEDALLHALLWIPKHNTAFTCTRRVHLPSWSIFAWKDIEFKVHASGRDPYRYSNIIAGIENQLGKTMDIEDYILEMTRVWDIRRFKTWIHLTGWMTSICFRRRHAQDSVQSTMGGKTYRDGSLPRMIGTDFIIADLSSEYLSSASWEAHESLWPIILFANEDDKGSINFIAGLILRHVEGDQYERLGAIQYMNVVPAAQKLSTTPCTNPMDQSYLQTMIGYEKRSIRLV